MSDLGQRIAGLTPQKRALLLKRLQEQQGDTQAAASEPIRPRPEPGSAAPLSFGQQRLWFLEQLEPGTGLYNLPISTRFVGLLEVAALERSLDEVVRRHEALRTTFEHTAGEPRQRVHPPRPLPLPIADLSDLPEAEREAEGVRRASAEAARPFDLERGPLLRALLLRLGPVEHVLVLTMHHAVSDGWSMGVLVREVRALYQGFWSGRPAELPPLPIQYPDFAAWQRSSERDGTLARQLEWWKERLAGELPVLQLPADRPRPAVQGHSGAAVRFQVPGTLASGLRSLAEGEGASLFMALLAAFDVLLSRYARLEDVLVGTPVANRNRRELEGLIGFFVNTLVLRTDLSGQPTFRELLARVRETALGAYAHPDVPFERLVEELRPERGLSHSPLFQVMFILQNPLEGATLGEGDFEVQTRAAKFDVTLSLAEVEGGLSGILEYRTDLFELESAARLCRHYQQLLRQALLNPDAPIGALALMEPAEERRVLLAWSVADEHVPAESSLHELFAQQAALTPEALAVIDAHERLSYAELERRANRLAHHLRGLGIGPGARVGVCLAREAALLVAVLGVLKAGAAYVPLDPAYPRRRLELMIADADVALVVTRETLGAALPADKRLCLDRAAEALAAERGDAAPPLERAPDLAYVIYTSGSTGRPKGVPVRHKSAAVVVEWALRTFGADELELMLAGTSLSWDPSVFEMFAPLSSGGALLLAENVLALPDLPAAAAVTCINTVPSALEALLARGPLPAGLRTLVLAGEPLRRATVAQLAAAPGLRVVNAYGPTEDTIFSTWAEVPRGAQDDPPIGRGLPNTRTYVLDPHGRPVPAGVPGELYLAGDGLSRGYLNQPELTRERFLPDPFSNAPDARLYRTGDLVRWRDDGQLAFLGRVDEQVKVRGFRVEPGELEAALREHPEVREAVAVVREEHGTKSLLAYVSALPPADEQLEARLREHLRERVPAHVWPAHLVVLDGLPRLASGKVDKRALKAPAPGVTGASAGQAPRGEIERALAELFAGLLGVTAVGRGDDFFTLGGHSLLATQLVARVRLAFGVDLPLRSVFEGPRLADLAAAIEAAQAGASAAGAPLVPVARDGILPLSYAQQRLYFLERLEPGTTAYAMPGAFRLRGPLDAAALERALGQVVARHEALRTTFAAQDGVPRQVIAAASAFELQTVGLDHEAVPEEAAARLLVQEAGRPYDLERGPLFRAALLRLRPDDHVLLLGMHHAISDGWSLGVLLRELNLAYAGALAGRAAELPALAVQYADYAVWQRSFLEGGERERQLAYWRGKLGSEPPRLELGEDGRREGASRQAVTQDLRLPREVGEALRALSRDEHATLFMTLLAAFKALLARLSGTHDVVVGTPVAGRQRAELEPLVGMFVNTLALRTDLTGALSFRELLARVRVTAVAGLAHQDVPFEALVEELRPARRLDGTPFFSVFFNLLGSDRGQASADDGPLRFEAFGEVTPEAKFDLTLYAREIGGELAFELVADAARFSAERLQALARQLDGLLRQVAADPDGPLASVVLETGGEPGRLPDPSTPLPWRDEGSLPRRLLEVAARAPERPALRWAGGAWSYGHVAAQSHRVAQALRQHGVERGEVVALYARRAPELPAALFGVLEAGAAFLVLDPAHPPARQLALLHAARPVALLEIETPLPEELSEWAAARSLRLHLDLTGAGLAMFPSEPVDVLVGGEDLAYLAFTSGTTGVPKGIRGPHAPLAHFAAWQARAFELGPDDCFAMLSGLSHDPLLRDVFTPLLAGARLAIPDAEVLREPARLAAWLRAEGVTVAHLTPALGRVLAAAPDDGPLPLRYAFFGGDTLTRRDVAALRRRAPQVRCVNFYGATETPQAMAFHVVSDEGPERVPLGRGIDGAQLLVVTEAGRMASVGEVGEIQVRSPYLAEGYLDDPAGTAARFLPNPFAAPDARDRVYRTGDRGRYRTDGAVEFVGRGDDQVQVRGFRVEPGDVAALLARVGGVADVAVAARPDPQGDPRLVAYVVAAPAAGEVAERCLKAARAALPDYMQPAAIVLLERLPLTPNGKLDRQRLPSPPLASSRPYEAPATQTERLVASVWSDVLGAAAPGRDDVFFELGGHSLLALQVVARLRAALGVDVPVRALFEVPTLRGFAERVERISGGGGDEEPPLGPGPRGARVPLSFAQRRLWFLDQLEPSSPAYNVSAALLLDGQLDVPALQRGLASLIGRHDALRTRFVTADGEPWQVCDVAAPEGPTVEDLSGWPESQRLAEAQARAASEAQRPFDLALGPLFRARLLQLAPTQHVLLWSVHHAVTDGWSFGLFLRELSELYEAECQGRAATLAPLPVQYADFAAWQRARLQGPKLAAELAHWRAELLGAPSRLELPTDRPRPPVSARRGRSRVALLPAELHQSLQGLARETGGTLYVVLLAAFQALLGRLSGQDDVVVGTPVAGRSRTELEGLIGFFANTLALRADLSEKPTFRELLARVRERVLQAFAHQELPFESLVEALKPERSLSHAPLFQVMFVLQNTPGAGGRLGNLRVSGLPRESDTSARFDLTLTLAETGDGLLATLEYDSELFEDRTARAFLERYRHLLAAVAKDPELRPAEVRLIDEAEEARMRALAEGPARPDLLEQPFRALFEQQVRVRPGAPALVFEGRCLSYAELDERAHAVAEALLRRGVSREALVGIAAEDGFARVAAVLGVWKAGAAYLPLDPQEPAVRRGQILSEAQPALLLLEGGTLGAFGDAGLPILTVEEALAEAGATPEPLPPGSPEDLAYVISTSGSTGRPKCVELLQRGLVNLALAQAEGFGLTAASRVLQFAAFTFDASVSELAMTLAAGGCLVTARRADLAAGAPLLELLRKERISAVTLPPSLLALLPERDLEDLQVLISAGEACPADVAERWSHGRRFFNAYGPSEVTVCATLGLHEGPAAPSIGRPLPNTRALVLDARLSPVPPGVAGELYVGGVGLARGYRGLEELTAQRFVQDPATGERLYRTGDAARMRADGRIDFLGRLDDQAKLRGQRVEPAEVEAALRTHPAVLEAAAVVRGSGPTARLLAWVVLRAPEAATPRELREHLIGRLPAYLVPAVVTRVDGLPRSASGKLDRRALPEPGAGTGVGRPYELPATADQRLVAELFAELLQQGRVGAADDFFELGGHSLLATQLVSRLRDALDGVELPLRQVFETPTVAGLAAAVELLRGTGAHPAPPLARAERGVPIPLSFAQQRLWFLDQLHPGSTAYHMPFALHLRGALDVPALERAIGEIVRRHDALRTRFVAGAQGPVQVVEPALPLLLALVDLDLQEAAPGERDARLRLLADEEARRPFDLERGPVCRFRLLRLGTSEHVLLVTFHHVVSDGWSMGLFVRELSALYEAFRLGAPSPLPELVLQYADFAAWQRGWLHGPALERQVGYWRGKLADLPALELPADFPRRGAAPQAGDKQVVLMPRELLEGLERLARKSGASLFMVLLAGYQALLARLTGQHDVSVGAPIANRQRAELEPLLGFFVNTLVLRTDLSGDPSFAELVERVREVALGAYAHQDLPFEKLVEELQPERDLGHSPLFRTTLALQNATAGELKLGGLEVATLALSTGSAKFELSLSCAETPAGLLVTADYDTSRFRPETVARLLQRFEALLAAAVDDPQRRLLELPLLLPDEPAQLAAWNATARPALALGLLARIEGHVKKAPQALAISARGVAWSYAELWRRSGALAARLRASGVAREALVAVCAERTAESLAGQLAVLRAGAAYLPLDPDYPRARLEQILEEAAPLVTLVDGRGAERLGGLVANFLRLDEATASESEAGLDVAPHPDDLAYVIYTSGSTGRPKGVMVPQRGLDNLVAWHVEEYGVTPQDRATLLAGPGFDAAVWESWPYLAAGASLHVPPDDVRLRPASLVSWLGTEGITLAFLPTPLCEAALREEWPSPSSLRALLTGGDRLRQRPGRQHAFAVVNHYGPTECSVVSTCGPVEPEGAAAPDIGRPIANVQAHVLDQGLTPLPPGLPGELWIGGAALARGYWRRPDLTAERFLEVSGLGRVYRTGDLARFLPDGRLEFLGRADEQIKLRGYRIEPGEIEALLREQPGVGDAAVIAREEPDGASRLVAYVVPGEAPVEIGLVDARVAAWATLFDQTYAASAPAAADFDVVGWHSSYTGAALPEAHMRAWVEGTVARLRELEPRRVLEIGCGTGLVLFRLAPECEQYCATDISTVTLRRVAAEAGRRGLAQVRLQHRPADDLAEFAGAGLDLVVLNSVVQYFPDGGYLRKVLHAALAALRPGGTLFVGDVRSLPLLEAFHAAAVRHQSPHALPSPALRERLARRISQEEELLVDPAFFGRLAAELPELGQVELLLRRGRQLDELTQFRYDALLRVGPRTDAQVLSLDWEREAGADLERALGLVAGSDAAVIVLRGVPNARVAAEVETLRALREGAPRPDMATRAGAHDPEDFWELAARLGRRVDVTWNADGPSGRLDVVFRRPGASLPIQDAPSVPWSGLTNSPLRQRQAARLVPALRAALVERLPDYMVPQSLVLLEELPLTRHGKLDRRALPAPEPGGSARGSRFVAPRTPVEEAVAAAWREVLRLESVGVDDDFFEAGGHSLLATQVVTRLRASLGVDLPVRALFEARTVARLAALCGAARCEAGAPALRRGPRDGSLPLSFAQQRLFFLDRLEPQSAAYNVPAALLLRGALREAALQSALSEIRRRHEALRTRFELRSGEATQVVDPPAPLPLPKDDVSALPEAERLQALERALQAEARQPFDLEHGPLLRARLLKLGEREHVLTLVLHHIVCDGWSMGVLVRELTALYESFCLGQPAGLPELRVQYADFTLWQREWLQGEALERQLAFWRETLRGPLPPLDLPSDRPRPKVRSQQGARLRVALPAELARGLTELAQAEGATLFMALLAGFQALLARYTGQEDVRVGTPVANRVRPELETLVGFFANTLVLRTDLSGDPTFRELLGRVRETAFAAFAHQDVPFERVVEQLQPVRDQARPALFPAMFALQNAPSEALRLGDLELLALPMDTGTAKFDLTLSLGETPQGLVGSLEYDAALFGAERMQRFVAHFERLLSGFAADPELRVSETSLLDAAEEQALVQAASGPPLATHAASVLELLDEQVALGPERIALRGAGTSLSYDELQRKSDGLAQRLAGLGVTRGGRVGLVAERTPGALVAVLGILKAGAACVPLDPGLPGERLGFLLADAGLQALVQPSEQPLALATGDLPVLVMTGAEALDANPCVRERLSPDDPVYVLYTSGSTGRPKGVVQRHGMLANLVAWQVGESRVGSGDVTLQFAPLSFDVSFQELFATWCSGGTLCLVPEAARRDPERLHALLVETSAARLFLPFAALQPLCEAAARASEMPVALREVITAGEALQATPALRAFFRRLPGCRLINQYGPTETHVATAYALPADPDAWDAAPPIGRPVAGHAVYVVDRQLRPVPPGVTGQLAIAGAGVALGYLARPELSAERFRDDRHTGGRMYLSGDMGRVRHDGQLEFLGREDDQVKLRGYRVELGEVEAALADCPGVRAAAAAVREGALGRRLIGYVVAGPDGMSDDELRRRLAQRLPEPLRPAAIVRLEALPLTPSGKLDRRALPEPALEGGPARTEALAPRDETELRLLAAFEEVLERRELGVNESFFDLGGHSLLALRLLAKVEAATGARLPVAALFETPTVEGLARLVRGEQPVRSSALVTLQASGAGQPLHLVPAAGGSAFAYVALARRLVGERPVHAFQAPGLEADEQPVQNLVALAALYVAALRERQNHGPYLLGGWSLGGVLAHEMAAQLEAAGECVTGVVLFDSYVPDPAASAPSPSALTSLFLLELGVLPPDVGSETVARRFEVFSSGLRASAGFQPTRIAAPLLLLQAEAAPQRERRWASLGGALQPCSVPGDHFALLREPHVATVAQRLLELLRALPGTPAQPA